MKTQIKMVMALLVCSAGLFANVNNAQGFELLDRMLGGGSGNCGCEATACCASTCGADRGCGADMGCGCGLFGHKHGCGCDGAARCNSCRSFSTFAAKSRCCGCAGPNTCAAKSSCNDCCGDCCCRRPLLNVLAILKLPLKLFQCNKCGCDSCDGGCGCEAKGHGCDSCGCHAGGVHKGDMMPMAKPIEDALDIPTPPAT